MEITHYPVLLKEVIQSFESLRGKKDLFFLDCTAGEGGHSLAILNEFPDSRILLNDRDSVMLERSKIRLQDFKSRCFFLEGLFSEIDKSIFEEIETNSFDGILLDFGISTFHLKDSERGFSFKNNEFLDMRLSIEQKLTAYEVINKYSSVKLNEIFRKYGEENWTLKIVDKILLDRKKTPIKTTLDLAKLVESVIPRKFWPDKTHPSFRVFQALRIEVNSELDSIQNALHKLPTLLSPNGILSAISFHSLEDRIVKNTFKELEKDSHFKVLTKKPIVPSDEEIELNFPSRSAKLRILSSVHE